MAKKKFADLAAPITADAERRARVDAYRRGITEGLRLGALRERRELTQTDVAEALHVSQARVSGIERQDDLYLSTLRSYVEVLGGDLEVVAVFPDERVTVDVAPPVE